MTFYFCGGMLVLLARFDDKHGIYHHRLLFLLVAITLFAATHLYRSPQSASDLEITPDSVEYAIGAQRLVTQGRFDIEINTGSLPFPATPPWFSVSDAFARVCGRARPDRQRHRRGLRLRPGAYSPFSCGKTSGGER
jgi:hypothetical protein